MEAATGGSRCACAHLGNRDACGVDGKVTTAAEGFLHVGPC